MANRSSTKPSLLQMLGSKAVNGGNKGLRASPRLTSKKPPYDSYPGGGEQSQFLIDRSLTKTQDGKTSFWKARR